MVVYTFSANTQEEEAGGGGRLCEFQTSLSYSARACLFTYNFFKKIIRII